MARAAPMADRISDDMLPEFLQFCVANAKMNMAEVAVQTAMFKKKKVEVKLDLSKVKQMKGGRYYIHIGKKLADEVGKEMFAAATEEQLIDQLYEAFFGESKLTLREAYGRWQRYRADIGTSPKTQKENANDWNRFLDKSELADKPVVKITVLDIKDFFMVMTKDYAVTWKKLSNVRGMLNGIMIRCVELGLIDNNPVMNVDYSRIKRRCRPVQDTRSDYTVEEKKAILEYLRSSNNPYDLAARFAFNVFLRVGELIAIKYKDIYDGFVHINRSTRREQDVSFDKNGQIRFGRINYRTEDRMKGNTEAGFHVVPLNREALEVVELTHALYPDSEFLFNNKGHQLEAGTINRHIRRACEAVGVTYRPSHQIRFTNAALLYDAGVPVEQISPMLGHSNTATTLHYIRKKKPTEATSQIVRDVLTA